MNNYILTKLLILVLSFNTVLADSKKISIATPLPSDSTEVKLTLDNFVHSIRLGNLKHIEANYQGADIAGVKTEIGILDAQQFDIVVHSIFLQGSCTSVISTIVLNENQSLSNIDLELNKYGNHWKIRSVGNIEKYIQGYLHTLRSNSTNALAKNQNRNAVIESYVAVQTRTLGIISTILPPFGLHDLNSSVTQQYIQKNLFSGVTPMVIDGITPTANPDDEVGFFLDPYWNRLIFSNKGQNWVKSYGDHPGQYKFNYPQGMEADNFDTVFVADTRNGELVKLYYNVTSSTISFVSSFLISGAVDPTEISIDDNGTPCTPGDDRIWLSDINAHEILQLDRSFNIIHTIKNYTRNGITY